MAKTPELVAKYIQNQLAAHIEHLLRNRALPQLHDIPRGPVLGSVGEAQLSFPEELEQSGYYVETGLLSFDDVDCVTETSAKLAFTDQIQAWVTSRSSASAFTMIGALDSSGALWQYPPLEPFPGSTDKDSGRSSVWYCSGGMYSTAVTGHPASIWSGKMMPRYVQAKYGAGRQVLATSNIYSANIDGEVLSNNSAQSHWIYEYRTATRLEWWTIEANSGAALNVGKLGLDALGTALVDYILDEDITNEEELDWLRTWIFANATWPTSLQQIEANLPAGSPLGYGWQVSDSGLLASIHSYEIVNDGTNIGSNWKRHDLTLSLTYGGIPEEPIWSVNGLTETDTGYLETAHYPGLAVWILGQTGVPALFITDSRVNPPQALPSDAEIYGRYIGETWDGVQVTDSGTTLQNCRTNGPSITCDGTVRICYTGMCTPGTQVCGSSRQISVDSVSADRGTEPGIREFFYSLTGDKLNYPEWQSGTFPGSGWCSSIEHIDECPGGDPLTNSRWAGSYALGKRDFTIMESITLSDIVGFAIPFGLSNAYITLSNQVNTATASTQTAYTGSAAAKQYVLENIIIQQYCQEEEIWLDVRSLLGGPNQDAIGFAQYNYNQQNVSGPVSRNAIGVSLVTTDETITLHSDAGGTSIASSTPTLDQYQGTGTVELAGWGGYLDTAPGNPAPEPIYGQRAAVQGIVSCCTAPGCAERVATDLTAGDPFPAVATWIGAA